MLILASKKLKSLDEEPIRDPEKILHLDVSNNYLSTGAKFARFTNLKTLILDGNSFYTLYDFPVMARIDTFSANKNKFANIIEFLESFSEKFPNAVNLSLVKNPICPLFEGDEKYEKYTSRVLEYLPKLRNLDGFDISLEAKKLLVRKTDNKPKIGTEDSNLKEKEEKKEDPDLYVSQKQQNNAYKLKEDGQEDAEEGEGEQKEEKDEKKLLTVIEYSERYKNSKPTKSMKLRSEGNRFVGNSQL